MFVDCLGRFDLFFLPLLFRFGKEDEEYGEEAPEEALSNTPESSSEDGCRGRLKSKKEVEETDDFEERD